VTHPERVPDLTAGQSVIRVVGSKMSMCSQLGTNAVKNTRQTTPKKKIEAYSVREGDVR
jgi:hypothetical protein